MRYTTPDSAQKMTKAATASASAARSNSRRPNSSPAKTSRFFVHWPGLREMSRFRTADRRDTSGTEGAEVPAAAMWGEVLRAI